MTPEIQHAIKNEGGETLIFFHTNFDLTQHQYLTDTIDQIVGVEKSILSTDFIHRYTFWVKLGKLFNPEVTAETIKSAIRIAIAKHAMKDTQFERTTDAASTPPVYSLPKEVTTLYRKIELLVPEEMADKIIAIFKGEDDDDESAVTYGIRSEGAAWNFIAQDLPTEESATEEALTLLKGQPRGRFKVCAIQEIATIHNEPTVTYE